MQKEFIKTEKALAAIGPYSQAVSFDRLVFTAGQIPLSVETGKIEGDTVRTQSRVVLENLKAVLEAGGSSLKQVIKTTVFLVDLGEFSELNQVYTEYFGESIPARSTIQVAALPLGALVEIEAIAVRN